MNVEVRHLQLVEAIIEEGSVTRAAERLNVTQSALSHQLREIEQRLRTPLFLRVNRRLALAPAGERLMSSAKRILGELRCAEEDIARLANDEQGVLRVSTECYTCYNWLPPLLAPFRARFPGVDVEIVPDVTRRTLDALLERKIDLALVHRCDAGPQVRLLPVFDDEVVVITAIDHPLAKRKIVNAADFAGEHLILHSPPEESFFASQLEAAHVRPRKYSQVILTEAITAMVKAGLGVSAVPRWTVAQEIQRKELAAIRFGRKGLVRRWSAAILKTAQVPKPVAAFVEIMRERWSDAKP
jgi:LysR family transcriptional regulator for metE and metH